MRQLLIGFDSAWTEAKSGALAGVLIDEAGTVSELGPPRLVRYAEAGDVISAWQQEHTPSSTLVLLDQPTIVRNSTGQRPVEKIVCPGISRRRGGMQPANRGRVEMFGDDAPIWRFLDRFGGAAELSGFAQTRIFETYPVLTMVSLGWVLPDSQRPAGRLPKYNPERRGTFKTADWAHVCRELSARLCVEGAPQLARWADTLGHHSKPTKNDQDRLDACVCLIVAMEIARRRDVLAVGNFASGYIVVPDSRRLRDELSARCEQLKYPASDWLRVLQLASGAVFTR